MSFGAGIRDQPAVSCLLADDSEPITDALEALLREEHIDVLGVAHTGLDALRLLRLHTPTAIVLDVRLPDLNGLEVARRAAEMARTRPAVIFYTSYADATFVIEALDAGARAVVLKDAPPENLLQALGIVANGGTYIDPRLRPHRSR
jgi:DNA-binding NarL/FixJ family response regulator